MPVRREFVGKVNSRATETLSAKFLRVAMSLWLEEADHAGCLFDAQTAAAKLFL
jgi:hypothetical protein